VSGSMVAGTPAGYDASQTGFATLPFAGPASPCVTSVMASPAEPQRSRPFCAIMLDSIIERMWDNILTYRTKAKNETQREGSMLQPRLSALVVAFCIAAPLPALAEDVLITQYKADPSGAPYGVGIEKGFFKKAGVDI